jgi:putative transposase
VTCAKLRIRITHSPPYRPEGVPARGRTGPRAYRPEGVPARGRTGPRAYRPEAVPARGRTGPRPYRPEGPGKIELSFETVRGQFLVEISPDGKPAPGRRVPAGLDQLNGWFTTWVEHAYHVRVHSSTGATPLARWSAGTPRFTSAAQLDAVFLWEAIRTMAARTATIKFQGNIYETAPELAGQQVTIRYSPFDLTQIEVFHRGIGHGHAQPHAIARLCHPKVKQPPQAVPAVTGIDYLQLLEDKRAAAHGTAHSISYTGLAFPAAGQQPSEEPSDDQ